MLTIDCNNAPSQRDVSHYTGKGHPHFVDLHQTACEKEKTERGRLPVPDLPALLLQFLRTSLIRIRKPAGTPGRGNASAPV
ncbi:MAG: hypothetical protein HY322_20255 [Betaproteobacteria bacterium]|nr:hypothetical protein [Betaproteobacteria bacterium]